MHGSGQRGIALETAWATSGNIQFRHRNDLPDIHPRPVLGRHGGQTPAVPYPRWLGLRRSSSRENALSCAISTASGLLLHWRQVRPVRQRHDLQLAAGHQPAQQRVADAVELPVVYNQREIVVALFAENVNPTSG